MKDFHVVDRGRRVRLLSKAAIIAGLSIGFCLEYVAAMEPDQMPTTQEPSQQPRKLKWFFDDDPRSSGVEVGVAHDIIKLFVVQGLNYSFARGGELVHISLLAKIEIAGSCLQQKNEILAFFVRLPQDESYGRISLDNSRKYDFNNLKIVKPGEKYYSILDCSDLRKKYLSHTTID